MSITDHITKIERFERELAERIRDQALAFLLACAVNVGAPPAPSELVDIGRHTFILDTHEYAAFCDRVAGRFLHHAPNDGEHPAESPADVLARTCAAMRKLGSCTGCHNGCHEDPPPAKQETEPDAPQHLGSTARRRPRGHPARGRRRSRSTAGATNGAMQTGIPIRSARERTFPKPKRKANPRIPPRPPALRQEVVRALDDQRAGQIGLFR